MYWCILWMGLHMEYAFLGLEVVPSDSTSVATLVSLHGLWEHLFAPYVCLSVCVFVDEAMCCVLLGTEKEIA